MKERPSRVLPGVILGLLAGVAAAAGPGPLEAQLRVSDLVFTAGLSAEGYRGDFSAVTVPMEDPSERVAAAVGQFGAWGGLNFLDSPDGQYLDLTFDAGLRQFAAMGYELRDYAPREWASRFQLSYGRPLGDLGRLTVRMGYRGRWVEDRPPLPLFLQPGYESFRGSAALELFPIQGVALDGTADLEGADYGASRFFPDILDRRSQGIELGARTVGSDFWSVRFFTSFRWSQYRDQPTSLTEDPFRRDRAVNIGATWSGHGQVATNLGIEGTVNRSNSNRPEYDAVSVHGDLTASLPIWELSTTVFTLFTWKSYVHVVEFDRLVPGEEADNASIVYLDLGRPLAENLDGVLRFGWTRAETDIGGSYYQRLGTTLLLNFRPGGR